MHDFYSAVLVRVTPLGLMKSTALSKSPNIREAKGTAQLTGLSGHLTAGNLTSLCQSLKKEYFSAASDFAKCGCPGCSS